MKYILFFACFLLALQQQSFAQQLVMPGDHPDPSVVKIGDHYWASATTSNWAPAFPLLSSTDLVNWKLEGHVFNQLPSWADYYFWAPEITYDNGKVYVYYSAHKKGGNLCVGVASADRPEGPYTDHGPLICQEVGSIDAFPVRDEAGKLYLVWKEDANSVGKPTSIWAQPLNEERTALTGEKAELFRNTEAWEGNLVEGVSIVHHGGYFYAIYAAAGCCGAACTYGTGVARAKNLLGPWEKYNKSPLLTSTNKWTCPGHGTRVEKRHRNYFLYHAYDRKSTVFTGREGVLIEYRYTPDGWIEFIPNKQANDVVSAKKVSDDFSGDSLSDRWQWSVFQQPAVQLKNGRLFLPSSASVSGNFLGRPTMAADYTVTVSIDPLGSTAAAGVAAIGDENNIVYAAYEKGAIRLVQVREGKEQVMAQKAAAKSNAVILQMQVRNGKAIRFWYKAGGKTFLPINTAALDAGFLPPWDRAVRAGVVSKGAEGHKAVFNRFEMVNQ